MLQKERLASMARGTVVGNRLLVAGPSPRRTTYQVGDSVQVTRDTTPGQHVREPGPAMVGEARWEDGEERYDVTYMAQLGLPVAPLLGLPVTALRAVPQPRERSRRSTSSSATSSDGSGNGSGGSGGADTDWKALFYQQQQQHNQHIEHMQDLQAQTLANRDETIRQLRQKTARLLVALQNAKAASKENARRRTELQRAVEQEQNRRTAELAQVCVRVRACVCAVCGRPS